MRHVPFFLAVVLAAPGVRAASIVPPVDLAELAARSDAVVLARAGEAAARPRGALVFTDTELEVERVVLGPLRRGDIIIVRAPGGTVGDAAWLVPGSPELAPGDAYLLFLAAGDDGAWTPAMLSHGILRETAGAAGAPILVPLAAASELAALPRPDGVLPEPVSTYERDALLAHLELVARGVSTWDRTLVETAPAAAPEEDPVDGDLRGGGAAAPPGCAFFSSGGRTYRWRAFDVAGGTATIYADASGDPSVTGGGFKLVVEALDKWHDITATGLNLVYGGPVDASPSCSGGEDAVANAILFNDPCSDISDLQGCSGVLGFGGPLSPGSAHGFDGTTWLTLTGWIVVLNDGVGCIGAENYRRLVAHELGHGLGFDHVADSSALMFESCCNNPNGTDRACTRFAYPAIDPANERPAVDAGGDRSLTLAGRTARLGGTVSDDGLPLDPGAVTVTWRDLGGAGPVVFSDPSSLDTDVTFPASGRYLIGLAASDGELLRTDAIEFDVVVEAGTRRLASFRQGVGGYEGTVDTFLQESAPAAANALAGEVNVDSDDPGGSGLAAQILLRFDDIFGDRDGQVPPGAGIAAAWLELTTTNDGDGAAIHRMDVDWDDGDTWAIFDGDGVQPGVEAASARDASAVGAAGVVRIDVTRSLAAWSEDPCSNNGWAFLPLGTDGWDFQSAEGAEPPRLVVEHLVSAREELIAVGDAWRYFKGRSDPPAGWREVDFVAGAGWLTGPSGIGYGDGDDATVVGDMRNGYLTLYLRREFALGAADAVGSLRLRIDYDDGFVAYLNGVEVARSSSMGAPGDPVGRNTPAAFGREAGSAEEFPLDPALLLDGRNVLAVEVHNASLDSGDLSFIPELIAGRELIPDGAVWRFLRGSQPLPADWTEAEFDDSGWEEGRTGIGYGDGDDLTVLDDMEGSYLAVFCRRAFDLREPDAVRELLLTVIHDDGIVVWLNGVEVGRVNVPAGPVGPATAASASGEAEVATLSLPRELIAPGRNVLAVSVHNSGVGSSDLSFMPVLLPVLAAPRAVDCDGPPSRFLRGDANDSGGLELADAVHVLGHLFLGGPEPECPDAADVDDSGALAINDAVSLLNYLFLGGPSPAVPGPGEPCGPDPTPDPLGECPGAACEE